MFKQILWANTILFVVFSVLLIFDSIQIVLNKQTLLMTSFASTIVGLSISLSIVIICVLINKSIKKV